MVGPPVQRAAWASSAAVRSKVAPALAPFLDVASVLPLPPRLPPSPRRLPGEAGRPGSGNSNSSLSSAFNMGLRIYVPTLHCLKFRVCLRFRKLQFYVHFCFGGLHWISGQTIRPMISTMRPETRFYQPETGIIKCKKLFFFKTKIKRKVKTLIKFF